MEDNKFNLFDKKEEEKKEKKSFVATPKLRKGKVANIILPKDGKVGRIIIDVNGNGEAIEYIEERHSKLKIGDPIEF